MGNITEVSEGVDYTQTVLFVQMTARVQRSLHTEFAHIAGCMRVSLLGLMHRRGWRHIVGQTP